MTIELVEVKKTGKSRFEINFLQDGQSKFMVIRKNRHWVEDAHEFISIITSEHPDFYNLWGDADFRKNVCQAIKALTSTPQLQTA